MPPIIDKKKCIGCHTCVKVCSADAYGIQKKGTIVPVVQYPNECWHCNACVLDCPVKAISLRFPVPAMMVFVDTAPVKKPETDKGK